MHMSILLFLPVYIYIYIVSAGFLQVIIALMMEEFFHGRARSWLSRLASQINAYLCMCLHPTFNPTS